MNDTLHALIAFAAGIGFGLAFFGGLWWTVQRVARGNGAPWIFPLSSLLRTALLLAGFWWIARGDIVRLALCLVGFLIARQLMIRRCGPANVKGGDACT